MARPSLRTPRSVDGFLTATLERVRPCPARPEYIEVRLTTSVGPFTWCFPDPPPGEARPGGRLALKMGRYGVQAHEVDDDGVIGLALEGSAALRAITAGANVHVAPDLVSSRYRR